MTVTFVTAIYAIHKSRSAEIWERFALLADALPMIIVCSASDADKIPASAIPLFRELDTFETSKILHNYNKLPTKRCDDKDTKLYMTIMNSKAEILKHVKSHIRSDHYVWIDAGIAKIFKNPSSCFASILDKTAAPLRSDKILIPGPWPYKETDIGKLTDRIHWRFCGGFFIVPYGLVDHFVTQVKVGCVRIGAATGCTTWEVNVWSFIESNLPIIWEKGDHNESILDCLDHYIIQSPAEEITHVPSYHEA
jgi:hypothetical protein